MASASPWCSGRGIFTERIFLWVWWPKSSVASPAREFPLLLLVVGLEPPHFSKIPAIIPPEPKSYFCFLPPILPFRLWQTSIFRNSPQPS